MDPIIFDDLTKALATGTSRRQALKTIAATTLGGLLGLGGIGTAFAKNMTCAQWCAQVFGDNTPADEQCTADAAHGTGLCYTCGPKSSTGGVAPSSICCTRDSSNYCTSYSGATCCSLDQVCCNGVCCDNVCCNGVCCSPGQSCYNGTCVTENLIYCDCNDGSLKAICNPTPCPDADPLCQQVCANYGGSWGWGCAGTC